MIELWILVLSMVQGQWLSHLVFGIGRLTVICVQVLSRGWWWCMLVMSWVCSVADLHLQLQVSSDARADTMGDSGSMYLYLSNPWLVTHRLQVWVQVHSKVPVGYTCRSLTVLQKTHTSRFTGKWLSTWSGQVPDWAQYSSWEFFLGIKVCHLEIRLRNWGFVWSSTMFGQVSWWLSEQNYWVEGQLHFIVYGSIQHIESVN